MKIILITILCLGIISCSVEDINTSSISTEMEQDFHYVSSDEAIIIANSFVQENGVIPVIKSEDLKIMNHYSINDSSNQPLLHVINYDRGGFAIVSADDRLQPIQAYSESGSFDCNEENYPLGLKIWVESTALAREYLKSKDGDSEGGKLAWR